MEDDCVDEGLKGSSISKYFTWMTCLEGSKLKGKRFAHFSQCFFALTLVGTMPNLVGIMPDGIVPPNFLELCLWNFAPRGLGSF